MQRSILSLVETAVQNRKGLAQLQKGITRFAARRPISAALIGLGALMIVRMIGGRR